MSSKHFINDPEQLVLDGLRALTVLKPNLVLNEQDRFIFNTKHDKENRVALISGGGSGHEPAHSALVGAGMLSAAVAGSIFASPSSESVLNCLRQVTGPKGVIVIVKQYTGDVLHFGLAAKKFASTTGLPVEVVIVGDDVSVPRSRSGKVGRRGLAGTVLVHKIAGTITSTQSTKTASQVAEYLRNVASNLVTIGATLDHVHVPGSELSGSIDGDELELGMGIHNEPGCRKVKPLPSLQSLVKEMLGQCLDSNDKERGFVDFSHLDQVVLLLNNLGGLSPLELGGVLQEVNKQLGIKLCRIFFGTYMTSLDARGFSITLLKADKEMIRLLDVPTKAVGWIAGVDLSVERGDLAPLLEKEFADHDVDTEVKAGPFLEIDKFKPILERCLRKLIAAEPTITHYDTVVGDGDCGNTLKRGAQSVLSYLSQDTLPISARAMLINISNKLEKSTDGTIGFIVTIFLHCLASSLPTDKTPMTSNTWASVANQALLELEQYTPAKQGDRTLVDALEPFVKTLNETKGDVQKSVDSARKGMEQTKSMKPSLGRAVYVNEEAWDKVPDPGAYGVVEFLSGLL